MTDLDHQLRAFLEETARKIAAWRQPNTDRYPSHAALILDRGRPWAPAELPPFVRPGPMKYCYQNTLDLIRQVRRRIGPELEYCEGYALPMIDGRVGIPVEHAWAVDRDGCVWDATWPEPERSAYLGIAFDWEEVERFDALGPDYLGIIPSEYLLGFPLLRTGRLFPGGGEQHDDQSDT